MVVLCAIDCTCESAQLRRCQFFVASEVLNELFTGMAALPFLSLVAPPLQRLPAFDMWTISVNLHPGTANKSLAVDTSWAAVHKRF